MDSRANTKTFIISWRLEAMEGEWDVSVLVAHDYPVIYQCNTAVKKANKILECVDKTLTR